MHAAPRQLKQRGTNMTTNRQRQRQNQKIRNGESQGSAEVCSRVNNLLGFRSPGSEVVSKEVVAKVTDFIPYAVQEGTGKGVLTYSYDLSQALAFAGSGDVGTNVMSRVKRVKIFAYPRSVNAGNAESLYAVMTAVPLRLVTSTVDRTIMTHQQVHLVMPSFTPSWKKVADIDFPKLMRDTEGVGTFVGQTGMVLFQLRVVDPDTGETFTGQEIQLKIEIHLNQPIPVESQIKADVSYLTEYGKVPTEPVPFNSSNMYVQIIGMSNVT